MCVACTSARSLASSHAKYGSPSGNALAYTSDNADDDDDDDNEKYEITHNTEQKAMKTITIYIDIYVYIVELALYALNESQLESYRGMDVYMCCLY